MVCGGFPGVTGLKHFATPHIVATSVMRVVFSMSVKWEHDILNSGPAAALKGTQTKPILIYGTRYAVCLSLGLP